MSKLKFRSIFLSDIHLGSKGCQSKLLLDFLDKHSCENLFLVGDIIDCWRLSSKLYWPQEHSNVFNKFLSMSKEGTKVFFITGNHDDFLRRYQPLQLGNIELTEEYEYQTLKNKKMLIIHGDQFDIVTTYGRHLALLGDWIYQFLLILNRYLNFFRSRLGYGYWSLSNYLKQKVKGAVNFMSDYEINVSKECQRRGFDGVVCGHIHKAEIKKIETSTYMNCGDWVESCTALIEDESGDFKIIKWGDEQREKIKLLKAS